MGVVGHEGKGINFNIIFQSGFANVFDKRQPIFAVIDDFAFFNASDHDVMQGSRDV
jgi:hypothetical protein